jgi:hypothetical protein
LFLLGPVDGEYLFRWRLGADRDSCDGEESNSKDEVEEASTNSDLGSNDSISISNRDDVGDGGPALLVLPLVSIKESLAKPINEEAAAYSLNGVGER